jgi:hypothetical protein
MRLKVLVTALAASAAVITAGAASAQGLLDGDWVALDDKNPRVWSETEILFPANDNDVSVGATCEALTGEEVAFVIDAFERPSKTTITKDKGTIDKNKKEEPAAVYGIIVGHCETAVETECFFGNGDDWFEDLSDCPGVETCDSEIELLNCETAKVKSTVNTKTGKVNWSAQAKKCVTVSAPITAAVDNACKRKDGRNKGISLSVKENLIKNLKMTGKSNDAAVIP